MLLPTLPLNTPPLPPIDPATARQAQRLANHDEYHAACLRFFQSMPTAPMNDTNQTIVSGLYPPREPPHCPTPRRTRSHSTSAAPLTLTDANILDALRSARKFTAAGPFADYTDPLRYLGLYETSSDPTDPTSPTLRPYFAAYATFQRYLATASLPTAFAETFRANYFTALYKDLSDLAKLRPLGIGFSWRRLLASTVLKHASSDFAAYLLPQGQLGVGIPGGIDTIVHLTRSAVESNIAALQAAGQSPTHALLLLDIVNMFNSVSRESCRFVLNRHPTLRRLLPLFDMLYDCANICWYRAENGSWSSFLQDEGFPQGCPLSPVLACLVLHEVLAELNTSLATPAPLPVVTRSPPHGQPLLPRRHRRLPPLH